MKCILAVALSFLLAGLAMASTAFEKTHQLWQSRIIYDDQNKMWFRALTTYQLGDMFVVLTLDRESGNCDKQGIGMSIALANSPAEKTYNTDPMPGFMQVDNNLVHNITFRLSGEKDNTLYFVRVVSFDGDDRLFTEFVRGARIVFTLPIKDANIVLPFSLIGFTSAQARSQILCDNNGREPPPPPPKPRSRPAPPKPVETEVNPF